MTLAPQSTKELVGTFTLAVSTAVSVMYWSGFVCLSAGLSVSLFALFITLMEINQWQHSSKCEALANREKIRGRKNQHVAIMGTTARKSQHGLAFSNINAV